MRRGRILQGNGKVQIDRGQNFVKSEYNYDALREESLRGGESMRYFKVMDTVWSFFGLGD